MQKVQLRRLTAIVDPEHSYSFIGSSVADDYT